MVILIDASASMKATDGEGDTGNGGAMTLTAGKTTKTNADGGAVTITAGEADDSSSGGTGGAMSLTAGAGAATGGAVTITTGLGTAASSGTMTLATAAGGSAGNSGSMSLVTGDSATAGATGDVSITTGDFSYPMTDVGAYALSEAGSGSDAFALECRAEQRDGGWVLNGQKLWITNGNVADVAVVWARTEDGIRGFVVPTGTPGFTAREIHKKLSLRASVTAELILEGVRLPGDAVLPNVTGLRGPLSCLNEARFGIDGLALADPTTQHRADAMPNPPTNRLTVPHSK